MNANLPINDFWEAQEGPRNLVHVAFPRLLFVGTFHDCTPWKSMKSQHLSPLAR